MRTQTHWNQSLTLMSYIRANEVALQLKEYALCNGYDPKGIKVLTKQQIYEKYQIADAQIEWKEGPEDWAYNLSLRELSSVYTEAFDGQTLSFYDK